MEHPNDLDGRVRRLDDSVEQLRAEIASLQLELATLASARREFQPSSAHGKLPARVPPPEARKPSLIPAALVVLTGIALLSWQLIATPRADRIGAAMHPATVTPTPRAPAPSAPTIEEARQATEPPVTPLVQPTIYRGTLAITADRPGAEVFVNRKPVGQVPVRVRNLRAGAHLVWVEHEGFRRWTRVVTVPAERVTRVAADLEPDTER